MNSKKFFISGRQGFFFITIALILLFFITQNYSYLLNPDIQPHENSSLNTITGTSLNTETSLNSEEFLTKTSVKAAADILSSLLWLKVDTYYHFNVSPEEVLPLIRIITYINSDFIDAWVLGAYIMCRSFKVNPKYNESVNFLKEAIQKNINNSRLNELYFEKGWNEFFYGKDFHEAVNSFKKALIHFNDKNSSSICTMTNYLKLFTYSCLLTGDHQCAYKTIKLLKKAYPESISLNKSILSRLYSNYDKSTKKFNLSNIDFKSFLKDHIKNMLPVNNTEKNNSFILTLNNNKFIINDIHKKIFSTHNYLEKIEKPILKGSDNSGLNNLFTWNSFFTDTEFNFLQAHEKYIKKETDINETYNKSYKEKLSKLHFHEKTDSYIHMEQSHSQEQHSHQNQQRPYGHKQHSHQHEQHSHQLEQHSHEQGQDPHQHGHHHHHHHKPILPNPFNILAESGIILFVFLVFIGVSYKKIY